MKNELKQIAKKNVGEALGVAVGTAGWMVPYYLPIKGAAGAFVKAFAEGTFSNACALPFVYYSLKGDIAADVAKGEIMPVTLAQEQAVEAARARKSCWSCLSLFKKKALPSNREPLLDLENPVVNTETRIVELQSSPFKAAR